MYKVEEECQFKCLPCHAVICPYLQFADSHECWTQRIIVNHHRMQTVAGSRQVPGIESIIADYQTSPNPISKWKKYFMNASDPKVLFGMGVSTTLRNVHWTLDIGLVLFLIRIYCLINTKSIKEQRKCRNEKVMESKNFVRRFQNLSWHFCP